MVIKKIKVTEHIAIPHLRLWIWLGIVIVALFIFMNKGVFLGTMDSRLDQLIHPDNALRSSSVTLDTLNQKENSLAKTDLGIKKNHDLKFGPIGLDNSAYVTDELDTFVKNSQESESLSGFSENSISPNKFSIQEVLHNPMKYIEGLSYATRQSFINNNRKTILLKLVDSVSRYFISYNRFPDLESYQDYGDYAWIQEMVDKNEMSGVYQYLIKATEPVAYCGTLQQVGYCYDTDGKDAILYVRVEKPFESDVCGMEAGLFLLWSSRANKFGNVCMAEEPTVLNEFKFFILRD